MKPVIRRNAKFCAMLGCAALVVALTPALAQQPAPPPTPPANRKVFANSVTPLPLQKGLLVSAAALAPEHQNETMNILFSLPIPKAARAELEAKVAKGEVVSPKELRERYSANAADAKALADWLKGQGFEVTRTSPDNTSVYAKGTVTTIEKSLQVQMARVTSEGITYNAARNAPSLPADVGAGVHAIIGLQPFRRAHKHSIRMMPRDGNRMAGGAGGAAGGPAATPNIANAPPYLIGEILKAYNADDLNLTGAGQTIAILIDRFPDDDDLKSFWKANSVSASLSNVEKINVTGVPLDSPEGEETLDAEWTTGIAPKAKVRIYASGGLGFVALDQALDRIIADLDSEPGMRQLSISLGLGEKFMGGADGEVAVESQKFLLLAGAGVNVFVSTGDAGSNPDETGHRSDGELQVEYESSDPSVIAVGGTSLTLQAASGKVAGEECWIGTGGGRSIFFPRPPWQLGNGVPSGSDRLVPDVSSAADPNKGAFIFLNGRHGGIGGTSWSAPTWAGFCALMNEARTKAGQPALPFLNPLIYPLLGTDSFRDITKGDNGAFHAGPGYDMTTGLGVPNIKALTRALTGPAGRAQ